MPHDRTRKKISSHFNGVQLSFVNLGLDMIERSHGELWKALSQQLVDGILLIPPYEMVLIFVL